MKTILVLFFVNIITLSQSQIIQKREDSEINEEVLIHVLREAEKPISFNVKSPVSPFIGRISELSELRWGLVDRKQIVLTGEKGVGKTEMAVKYAQEFKYDNQSSTIFLDSTSHETLMDSFKDLGIRIGVKFDNKVILTIIRECVEYFKRRKTLFIFDNCGNDNALVKEIPNMIDKSRFISVVITSRSPDWGEEYKTIKIQPFNKEESTDYIKKSLSIPAPNIEDHHIEKLTSIFGNLPLTLNRVISFIENRIVLFPNKNMDEYINDLENNKKEIIIEKHFETVTRDPTEDEIQSFLLDKINDESKAISEKVSHGASEAWEKVSTFVSDKVYHDGIKVAANKVADVAKDVGEKFKDVFGL